MINQWTYLWKEAFAGLGRAKTSSLTAVLSIGVSTSILSVFFILIMVAHTALEKQSGEIVLRAYVGVEHESFDALDGIEEKLGSYEAVDSIRFISKEEALEEFNREFDNNMAGMLTHNPLPPSFILWPKREYRFGDSLFQLAQRVKQVAGIEAVSGTEAYQNLLNKWKRPALWAGLGLLIFLGAAVSLIISNAVKLNLLARKELVDSMMYCGASAFFITAPFLLEGLVLGGAGSLLGIGAGLAFVSWVAYYLPGFALPGMGPFALGMLAFAAVLSSGSGFWTVRKFIRDP